MQRTGWKGKEDLMFHGWDLSEKDITLETLTKLALVVYFYFILYSFQGKVYS